mmetsp:Transcript_10698/g.19181  ORF Transcript_10698/g.19181 Transcript_10698/m.19181 type:complete len:233 (-) Transcript_10698:81-779(-)
MRKYSSSSLTVFQHDGVEPMMEVSVPGDKMKPKLKVKFVLPDDDMCHPELEPTTSILRTRAMTASSHEQGYNLSSTTTWYTRDELRNMRKREQYVALRISEGVNQPLMVDGLQTTAYRRLKKERVEFARKAVLGQQERMSSTTNIHRKEASIAREYSRVAGWSRRLALQRGKDQERELYHEKDKNDNGDIRCFQDSWTSVSSSSTSSSSSSSSSSMCFTGYAVPTMVVKTIE